MYSKGQGVRTFRPFFPSLISSARSTFLSNFPCTASAFSFPCSKRSFCFLLRILPLFFFEGLEIPAPGCGARMWGFVGLFVGLGGFVGILSWLAARDGEEARREAREWVEGLEGVLSLGVLAIGDGG